MKRQRTNSFKLNSCSQQLNSSSSSELDLPDDIWERVFRLLKNNDDDDHRKRYLKSLSVASKHFLSVTNRHKFCLTILYPALPVLPGLLQRFTKLTSLDLSYYYGDLDALLTQISSFPMLKLTSLNLSNQLILPANGLRAFSQNITTLTSLICSNLISLNSTDIHLIADTFPLLEELDLAYPSKIINHTHATFSTGLEALSLALIKLRKVNLSYHGYLNGTLLSHLFKNCKLLQEVILLRCEQLTIAGVDLALLQKPILTSLSITGTVTTGLEHLTSHFIDSLLSLKGLTSLLLTGFRISDQFLSSIAMESLPLRRLVLSYCPGYTYSGISFLLSKSKRIQHLDLQYTDFLNDHCVAELSLFLGDLLSINLGNCRLLTVSTFFALITNCPSLTEINMNRTNIQGTTIPNSLMDRLVNPQFKSLFLASAACLEDQNIIMFAALFPNLQQLHLSCSYNITEEGIRPLLESCRKIRHLNLTCLSLKSLGTNFDLPDLEVLNLTNTEVDDEALYIISNRCPALLQLVLLRCDYITDKGVMHVVNNCTQLREINLDGCPNVQAKVVASMVVSRPSLRKIHVPPNFPLSDRNRKLFSRHGCLLVM